jgi:hypothetical protein
MEKDRSQGWQKEDTEPSWKHLQGRALAMNKKFELFIPLEFYGGLPTLGPEIKDTTVAVGKFKVILEEIVKTLRGQYPQVRLKIVDDNVHLEAWGEVDDKDVQRSSGKA